MNLSKNNIINNKNCIYINSLKERNLAIDLLKIFAMFLIVLSHWIPWWELDNSIYARIDIRQATDNVSNFIIIVIRYFGQIGNCIFIICSSWFLLDNNKINIKRVLSIIINTFLVSIIIIAFFIIFKQSISFKQIVKSFFPITFNNNWFIGTYLFFYIVHPILNFVIKNFDKRTFLKVNIFLVIYFYIWQFIHNTNYIKVFGFIIIYFLVAYMKKYLSNFSLNKKNNFYLLEFSFIFLILFLFMYNILAKKYSIFNGKMQYWANIINPFIVLISISIFNILRNINVKNKIISYISSMTLIIYIIHDNFLIRDYLKSFYYEKLYFLFGYKYIIEIVLITAVVIFIISTIFALIYKETIEKLVNKISNFITNKISKLGNKLIDLLLVFN